jgi:hypothetical protein
MVIDQRNAGASVTNIAGNVYSLDRWSGYGDQASKYTMQQSTTAPTGFINSLKVTSSSAYTVGSSEFFILQQKVEGLNCTDLGWGTASATTVTLSFKVYSSLTGTFGGSILNYDNSRSYPFSYTVSSANTWTNISITVAGDTSGTWLTTNGVGIQIVWGLGAGATVSGTAGSWSGNAYYSATGAVSVVGTSGATFYITGVQLEVGSSATGFEYRQYGQELVLCQRYYQKSTSTSAYGALSGYAPAVSGTLIYNPIVLPVTMRVSPTSLESANIQVLDGVTTYTGGSFAIDTSSNNPNYSVVLYTHGSSVFTQYRTYGFRGNNNTNAYLAFSAEL